MIKNLINNINQVDIENIKINMNKSQIVIHLKNEDVVSLEEINSFFFSNSDESLDNFNDIKPIIYEVSGFDVYSTLDHNDNLSFPNLSICLDSKNILVDADILKYNNTKYRLK